MPLIKVAPVCHLPKQARLDNIICSYTLLDIVNTCVVNPGYITDHSFVVMK